MINNNYIGGVGNTGSIGPAQGPSNVGNVHSVAVTPGGVSMATVDHNNKALFPEGANPQIANSACNLTVVNYTV